MYIPQNIDQKADTAFRRRRRSFSPSNRLQIKVRSVWRAPWTPPNHPESSLSLFRECIAGEREWSKMGCEHVPLFDMLTRGCTPPSLLRLRSPPFWCDFPPFGLVADWCTPDWLKNTTGGWLFQLVVVVAGRKDHVPRRNHQRPRPAQTWWMMSIQHTWSASGYRRAWFRDYSIPWWNMIRPGREWFPCRALVQRRRLHIAQTEIDTEDNCKSCNSFGPSEQRCAVSILVHPFIYRNAIHNTTLHRLTIMSNTFNLLFYTSRCTLCVDPLQARPGVVGGEAGMAKHAPLMYSSHHNTYYMVLRCMGIDYNSSIQQQRIYVHRAPDNLQHFRHLPAFFAIQCARTTIRLFLDKAYARGAQMIRYPYVPGTMTFGFSKRMLVLQVVGRWAVRRQWWWIYEKWGIVEARTSCWAVGSTTTCISKTSPPP